MSEEFSFMKETIKDKPFYKKKWVRIAFAISKRMYLEDSSLYDYLITFFASVFLYINHNMLKSQLSGS